MDCRDVTTIALNRLAGEAGEAERRELAAHLAGCETCRREMARLEDVWTILGTDPDAEITSEFRERSLALLEEETLRRRVREFRPRPRASALRPLLRAAALLAAAAIGWVAARGLPSLSESGPSTASGAPRAIATPSAGIAAASNRSPAAPDLSAHMKT